jgi:hypothetical protein
MEPISRWKMARSPLPAAQLAAPAGARPRPRLTVARRLSVVRGCQAAPCAWLRRRLLRPPPLLLQRSLRRDALTAGQRRRGPVVLARLLPLRRAYATQCVIVVILLILLILILSISIIILSISISIIIIIIIIIIIVIIIIIIIAHQPAATCTAG